RVRRALRTRALYCGTGEVPLTVTSANPDAQPNSRTDAAFTAAALDGVEARILQGIHTRSADLHGRHLGRTVARWVFKHALTPLKHHRSNGYDDDDQNDQD